ncbi:cell division protein SepF [Peptostreptococcaceae bacterium oral taxon 929]|nr:cell division protein SepF [Peptostreptococcaceae bacterium oral taxon 929]
MGFMDKVKYFLGFGDDDYDEEYYDDEDEVAEEEPQKETSIFSRKKEKENVVPIQRKTGSMVITVQEPLGYDEAPLIIDDLRLGKAVVVNFEQLEASVKRQIFDFINGGIYAIDGSIQKVTRDIFVLAPKNVAIDGLKDELKSRGMFPF